MSDTAVDGRSQESSARSAKPSKLGVGYAVYEPVGQKIGSAEEVFMNRDGEPVYDRVRTGLLGMRSVLIPVQFDETDESRRALVLKMESLASYSS